MLLPRPVLDEVAVLDAPGLDDVEQLMRSLAAGDRLARCGVMAAEHLATGGKRMRARLALAATCALGGDLDAAAGWAAACELLHNATLVHDDLQDGDTTRRGVPTTWVRHGAAQAINAGDLMLMLPFLAVQHVPVADDRRWALARGLADHAAQTVRGQSLDMTLLSSRRLTWADYVRAAEGKTSALLTLPVYGAAVISGRDPAYAARLAAELLPIGVLFQVQDDVLDLFGDKGRHEVGSDIREGKVSALVVEHLRLYPVDTEWLCAILARPREQTSPADVESVRVRFRDGGALEEVLDRIYELARQTLGSPLLAAEPGLDRVARVLLERVLGPIRHLDPTLPTGDVR